MSHLDKGVYTASCNPPRRAKRPRTDADGPGSGSPPQTRNTDAASASPVAALSPRPILPKRTTPSGKPANSSISSASPIIQPAHETPTASPPIVTTGPGKRGRKPGPLSRSAREAQRRLNHSIIEKARRTKINNALATLKELVPADYGKKAKEDNSDDEDDGEDDEGDDEYGSEKKKPKSKQTGKKEEKEREYKLEILVRTVTFLQDLLQRVAILEQENPLCSNCGGDLNRTHAQPKPTTPTNSGRASPPPPTTLDPETAHRTKRSRIASPEREPGEPVQMISPQNTPPQELVQEGNLTKHRLPSISSWLPETLLDPSIFNVSPSRGYNKDSIIPLQLPTPPSSTHFNPTTISVNSASAAPFMLPGGSSSQKVLSPTLTRTPEDEHAATMLLQISGGGISSSPTFRPLPPSIVPLTGPVPSISPPLPSCATKGVDHGSVRHQERRDEIAVQTPASLLGLVTSPSS
ncbi:hypothetical protein P691DRAFT_433597 [Macrolepiota fuliginosa MF-IS2]|uniref:BHLH domain-containing protein n=1 Tax=Macrolepiota fuliginosa MF-IS2 TaxID=1400762 RepID=A0A9P5XHH4_9AGAR|nr:hypothetical protein P691DRAFT_433597 [Macrolepiota fuliginosa MF-IS2]